MFFLRLAHGKIPNQQARFKGSTAKRFHCVPPAWEHQSDFVWTTKAAHNRVGHEQPFQLHPLDLEPYKL